VMNRNYLISSGSFESTSDAGKGRRTIHRRAALAVYQLEMARKSTLPSSMAYGQLTLSVALYKMTESNER